MVLLKLRPRDVTTLLLTIIVALTVAGVAVQISEHALSFRGHERLLGLRRLLDLDEENNVPSLYSSFALLWCAFLLAGIAVVARHMQLRYQRHWVALAAIFLYLSFDEGARIHESAINPLRSAFSPDGIWYYAWIVPALAAVFVIGMAYLRFLGHLQPSVRLLFAAAFFVYMLGAVGGEMVEGIYATEVGDPHDRLDFNLVIAFEEFLEMMGVAIFSHALMSHLTFNVREVRLSIEKLTHPVSASPELGSMPAGDRAGADV